jgi:TPR repeat protein
MAFLKKILGTILSKKRESKGEFSSESSNHNSLFPPEPDRSESAFDNAQEPKNGAVKNGFGECEEQSPRKTQSAQIQGKHYNFPEPNREAVEATLMGEAENALTRFFRKGPLLDQFSETEEIRYADYKQKSIDELKQLAEKGDASAQYLVGDYYAELDESYASQARMWWQRGAENGNADAMYSLGYFLNSDFGGTRDVENAILFLKKAAGCGNCYAAAISLREIYSERFDWENEHHQSSTNTLKELVTWSAVVAYGYQDDIDDGAVYMGLAASAFYCYNLICMAAEFEMGLEHTPLAEYEEKLDYCLIAWYWQMKAQETGRLPGDWKEIDLSDMLCQIGECALELNKPYAIDVLALAVQMGSDYAVSVAAFSLIHNYIETGVSRRDLREDPTWIALFGRVKDAVKDAEINTDDRRKAHSLLALSSFYMYGAGCFANIDLAYQATKQAADMGYGKAKHMLEVYIQQPDGSYRIKQ